MRNTKITATCVFCGVRYHPNYGKDLSSFCSSKCYLTNRWGPLKTKLSCAVCGSACRLSRHKYCSRRCVDIAKIGRPNPGRSNREQRQCEWCGIMFGRPVSDFHSKISFCSRSCAACWQSDNIRGQNHPRWRGGYKSFGGYGVGWRAARHEAIRKAKGRCKKCKAPAKCVHHRIPARCFEKPSDAHFQKNLMVLCRRCHPKEEKKSREAVPLFDILVWNRNRATKKLSL